MDGSCLNALPASASCLLRPFVVQIKCRYQCFKKNMSLSKAYINVSDYATMYSDCRGLQRALAEEHILSLRWCVQKSYNFSPLFRLICKKRHYLSYQSLLFAIAVDKSTHRTCQNSYLSWSSGRFFGSAPGRPARRDNAGRIYAHYDSSGVGAFQTLAAREVLGGRACPSMQSEMSDMENGYK